MKNKLLLGLLLIVSLVQAQTARKFTLDLTDDGKAQMVCFLPTTPSGKAIVGVPGGGYSVLSNTHEGYLASEWLNDQGIAYFVVNYRLPYGDRTLPMMKPDCCPLASSGAYSPKMPSGTCSLTTAT